MDWIPILCEGFHVQSICPLPSLVLPVTINQFYRTSFTHPPRSAYGDVTEGLMSTGAIKTQLSRITADQRTPYVGELGNIQADAHGVVNFTIEDSQVQLRGNWSVVV